jgi:Uma2 family endonuclease
MSASVARSIEPDRVRPLKRSEYDQMVELGLFNNERVELIGGVLVKMSPQHAPHSSTVQMLYELLMAHVQGRYTLRIQFPLALSDDSEPEPDLAIVPLGRYRSAHPSTAVLVIEVSDSSLKTDRTKAAVYAAAGIGEYWIVNLGARAVEVYTVPRGERYTEVRTVGAGETLRPAALPDVAIEINKILSEE